MEEQENLSLTEYPSIQWKKFFDRATEVESLSVDKWESVHIIHYFCKKYIEHYDVKFSFRFNAAPSKSYELFQMRKLGQQLSTDPQILKDYIDWFFEYKIILKKKRITSLAFLTEVNIVNEFKFKKLAMDKTQNIDRTAILPVKLVQALNSHGKNSYNSINTYGELAFLHMSLSNHPELQNNLAQLMQTYNIDITKIK